MRFEPPSDLYGAFNQGSVCLELKVSSLWEHQRTLCCYRVQMPRSLWLCERNGPQAFNPATPLPRDHLTSPPDRTPEAVGEGRKPQALEPGAKYDGKTLALTLNFNH